MNLSNLEDESSFQNSFVRSETDYPVLNYLSCENLTTQVATLLLKHILQLITYNHQIVWSYFNVSLLFQTFPPSNTTTTTTPTPPGGGTDPSCPTTDPSRLCTNEGYVRDPCNWQVFFQCKRNNGVFTVYRFECPAGLVFDPSLNVCNWPDNVPN
jgi:hypothetical protein